MILSRAAVDNLWTRTKVRYGSAWPLLNWSLFALGLAVIVGSLPGVIPYGDGANFGDGRNYWEGLAYSDEHYRYSAHPIHR